MQVEAQRAKESSSAQPLLLPQTSVEPSLSAIDLWSKSIRNIEGRQGSVVASALHFIRFGLAVNSLQLLVWGFLVVLPFVSSPPDTFAWAIFRTTRPRDLLQGYGLGSTFLFYGGYRMGAHTQRSRPDLCFPVAYILAYALTIAALVKSLHRRLQGFSDGGAARAFARRMYPFCTLAFASWNFRTAGWEAARLARRELRSRLKELVSDASAQEVFVSDQSRAAAKLRKVFSLGVLWPSLMAATGIITYLAVVYSAGINRVCGLSYMSSLIVTGVNIGGSALVKKTVELEGWAPHSEVKALAPFFTRTWHTTLKHCLVDVAAFKLFTLKADYMGVLLYSLYRLREETDHTSLAPASVGRLTGCEPASGVLADGACAAGFMCCGVECAISQGRADLLAKCVPGCVENVYGQVFYRQVVTNGVVINFVDLVVAVVKRQLLKMHVPFESHAVMMQSVENGVLVLLGTLYFPLLPALGMLGNVITFYMRVVLARFVCHPPKARTSAARMAVLAYLLMASGVALSSFPLVLNLGWQRHRCGPNQDSSMRDAIVKAVNSGPSAVSSILGFLVSPVALLTLILGLLSGLVLMRGLSWRLNEETEQLQRELKTLRKAQRLLSGQAAASDGGEHATLHSAISLMRALAAEGQWRGNEVWEATGPG